MRNITKSYPKGIYEKEITTSGGKKICAQVIGPDNVITEIKNYTQGNLFRTVRFFKNKPEFVSQIIIETGLQAGIYSYGIKDKKRWANINQH